VITFDALHTGAEPMERVVVGAGADFIMPVKGNTPALRRRILGELRKGAGDAARAETLDKEHGRIESRKLELVPTSPLATGWPHTHCAFRITRRRDIVRDGEIRGSSVEEALFTASFPADAYEPEQVLRLVRGHWTVENCLHHRKDRTMDEDRNRAAEAGSGRVMCAIRSISAMLGTRMKESFKRVRRRFAGSPQLVLALLSSTSVGEWEESRRPYKTA
jgi:predicted transposase YbfD/YdcC